MDETGAGCRRVQNLLGALNPAPLPPWCLGSRCRCGTDHLPAAGRSSSGSEGPPQRPPRTIHQLREEQGHSRYTYSAANPLSATIDSGDIIEVQCWDSSEHDAADPDTATVEDLLNRTRPTPLGGWGNPVCDPVFVNGAQAGDTLQIEILALRSGDWGWTCITDGFGLLAGNDSGVFPDGDVPALGTSLCNIALQQQHHI